MSSGPDPTPADQRDDLDIVDPDTFVHGFPHATFRRLRDTQPLSWWPEHDGGKGFWAVTRYDDLLQVSRNVEVFSSAQGVTLEEMDPDDFEARRNMLEYDPPQHTRYRRLVSKPFSRREVYAYEQSIRLLARSVVDEVRGTSEFDFVERVAKQLPMRMLGRLLGVPDHDGDWLVERGDALLGNFDPEMTEHPLGLTDTDEFKHIPFRSPAALDLYRYAEAQAEQRRANPTDDVITHLLAPTIDGEQLTETEFKNFFVLLVGAGNDTTRYTMTGGLKALVEHPDQLAELRDAAANHNGAVVESAVEEILRWATVTMNFRRTATCDTELHGTRIARGDKVVIWYSSADFDERHFPDPFRFDIHRTPNDHVAFGRMSPHLCLGAQLARMELKVLFEELLPALADVRLDGCSERLRSNFICGIKRMPVKVAWA